MPFKICPLNESQSVNVQNNDTETQKLDNIVMKNA